MLADIYKSKELISKVAFDLSEVNFMFVMPLFQWCKSKKATSVLSATTLTLPPVSATCNAHRAISECASLWLVITLFKDLIKQLDNISMKRGFLVLFDRKICCLMLTFVEYIALNICIAPLIDIFSCKLMIFSRWCFAISVKYNCADAMF